MPLASTENLRIDEQGNVIGPWKAANIKHDPEENYLWAYVHPSNKIMLQAAIKDDAGHRFLIAPNSREIMSVLLVKDLGTNYPSSVEKVYQFVGSLYFRSAYKIDEEDLLESLVILNSPTSNLRAAKSVINGPNAVLNSNGNTKQPAQNAR